MTEDTHIERIAAKVKKICGHNARLGLHTESFPDGKLDTSRSYWTLNIGPVSDRRIVTQKDRLDQIESYLDSYRA